MFTKFLVPKLTADRLTIHVSNGEDGITVLGLHGQLRMGAGPQALEMLTEGLAAQGRGIILDLSNVRAIDSRGLGSLVNIFTKLSPSVRRIGTYGRLEPLVAVCKLETVLGSPLSEADARAELANLGAGIR